MSENPEDQNKEVELSEEERELAAFRNTIIEMRAEEKRRQREGGGGTAHFLRTDFNPDHLCWEDYEMWKLLHAGKLTGEEVEQYRGKLESMCAKSESTLAGEAYWKKSGEIKERGTSPSDKEQEELDTLAEGMLSERPAPPPSAEIRSRLRFTEFLANRVSTKQ